MGLLKYTATNSVGQ